MNYKILISFLSLLLYSSSFANNSASQQTLFQADSLFDNEKYTEAIILYDSLFYKENKYSPQLLMKLSFIEEGLGNYQKALYYLNYLYFWHPEQSIELKMSDLAEKHDLSGYNVSEINLLYEVYIKHKTTITYVLVVITIIFIGLTLFFKLNKNEVSYASISFGIFFIVVLFSFSNYNPFPRKAIIGKPNTALMTQPASASELIETSKKGNRVSVLGTQDDWYLIEYQDTTAYVKKGQLKIIEAY